MLKKLVAVGAVTIALAFAGSYAQAKAPPCSKDEIAIKDDRPGKKKICLKKSEMEKAKKACGKKPWMGCICQDGDSVGACGT